MSAFLHEQLDYTCLVYLLGCGILAAVCFSMDADGRSRLPWAWIGAFAVIQAVSSLLCLVECCMVTGTAVSFIRTGMDILSAVCLVEFARQASHRAWGRSPGPWIHIVLLAVTLLKCLLAPHDCVRASLHFLATVGGFWGAAAVFRLLKTTEPAERRPLYSIGAIIFIYPLLIGFATGNPLPSSEAVPACGSGMFVLGVPLRLVLGILCLAASAIVSCEWGNTGLMSAGSLRRRPLGIALLSVVLLLVAGWFGAQSIGSACFRASRSQLTMQLRLASLALSPVDIGAAGGAGMGVEPFTRVHSALRTVREHVKGGLSAYLVGYERGTIVTISDGNHTRASIASQPNWSDAGMRSRIIDAIGRRRVSISDPPLTGDSARVSIVAPVHGTTSETMALYMDVDASEWLRSRYQHRAVVMLLVILLCTIAMTFGFIVDRINRSRAQIVASERKYRSLVEGSPNAIALFDCDARCLAVNGSAVAALGTTGNELVGVLLTEIWTACDELQLQEAVDQVLNGNRSCFEGDSVRDDGRVTMWSVSLNAADGSSDSRFVAIGHDITERKLTDWALRHRIALEEQIAIISGSLIGLGPEEVDPAIATALRMIGEYSGSDRGYVLQCDDSGCAATGTHEWLAGDVELPIGVSLANHPILLPSYMERIAGRETLRVPSTMDLPGGERRTFESHGIRSLIAVPLVYHGELTGILGFDAIDKEVRWSEEDIRLLHIVGDIIVNALQRRRTAGALRESEGMFRTLAESARVAICIVQGLRFVYVNPCMVALSEYTEEEILSLQFTDILHPDYREMVMERSQRRQTGAMEPSQYEMKIVTKSGRIRWMEFTAAASEFGGKPVVVCVSSDITERVIAEQSLRESEERYRVVAEQTGQLIYDYDPSSGCIKWSGAIEAITGFTAAEFVDVNISGWMERVHPDDRELAVALFRTSRENESRYCVEIRCRRKDGAYVLLENHGNWIRSADGHRSRFVGSMKDVTEKRGYETKLRHMAHHDALTDLPNRLQFRDHLRLRLDQAAAEDRSLAVVFVDLDRFKLINDTLGHNVGDLLLRDVATRLPISLRPTDLIARMGGDEFTIVLWDVHGKDGAAGVASRILESLSKPFVVSGHELFISASIGISVFPSDGHDVETLVKNADTAMYRAKEQGRGNYQFFTESLSVTAVERMQLLNSLRKAVDGGQFIVHYQPVLDLGTGEIVGAEALVRWKHPEYGLLSPDRFIPLAEESGLVTRITECVLHDACTQASGWRGTGSRPIGIAVNVSPSEIHQTELVSAVRRTIAETGFDPRRLTLEITETALARNPEMAIEVLGELKRLGVSVALDDFGSGYSSLNVLKRFPVDVLKMDKSFVREIAVGNDDAAIAQAIVTMAHSLKLRVVAEGVETLAQLDLLSDLDCDQMQGYFIGRPVSAQEFAQLLPRPETAVTAA